MRCPRDIPQPLLLRGENCNLCISAIDLGKGFVFAKKSLQHCAQPRCHSRSTMGLNQAKTGNILPYCGRFDRIQKSLRIAIVAVLRLSSHAFPGRLLWRQRRLRQSPAIASPQNLWGHYGGTMGALWGQSVAESCIILPIRPDTKKHRNRSFRGPEAVFTCQPGKLTLAPAAPPSVARYARSCRTPFESSHRRK